MVNRMVEDRDDVYRLRETVRLMRVYKRLTGTVDIDMLERILDRLEAAEDVKSD